MASVPNRVYPQSEFREIRTDIVRAATSVLTPTVTSTTTIGGVSGSFTSAIAAPVLRFSTTNTLPPSGSMGFGDLAMVTGSDGTSVLLYLKVKSGSGNAIYSIACTYVSSGSA